MIGLINLKHYFKTEESKMFTNRCYGTILLVFNLGFSIYCLLTYLEIIEFKGIIYLVLLFIVLLVPFAITAIIYEIIFDKNGTRRR